MRRIINELRIISWGVFWILISEINQLFRNGRFQIQFRGSTEDWEKFVKSICGRGVRKLLESKGNLFGSVSEGPGVLS